MRTRRTLAGPALPSEPGKEREAMDLVAETVRELGLPRTRLAMAFEERYILGRPPAARVTG